MKNGSLLSGHDLGKNSFWIIFRLKMGATKKGIFCIVYSSIFLRNSQGKTGKENKIIISRFRRSCRLFRRFAQISPSGGSAFCAECINRNPPLCRTFAAVRGVSCLWICILCIKPVLSFPAVRSGQDRRPPCSAESGECRASRDTRSDRPGSRRRRADGWVRRRRARWRSPERRHPLP